MFLKHSIRQNFRAPVRLMASFVVTALICAFLSVGLNLRQIARSNLRLLKEEFDVVAIPTFTGSVNKYGELVYDTKNDDYQGFLETDAKGFDVSVFENAAGVKDVLVHKQFGAYWDTDDRYTPGDPQTRNNADVIIFTYNGEEPLVVEHRETISADITVNWSARGYEKLPVSPSAYGGMKFYNEIDRNLAMNRWPKLVTALGVDEMWQENAIGKKNGTVILQPGQTYITCGEWSLATGKQNGIYRKDWDELSWIFIKESQAHSKQEVRYEKGGFYAELNPDAYTVTYPCILPYTEDFWETEAGAYYKQAAEICKINGNAMPVVATDDLSLYKPFYDGNVYLISGRNFTQADYQNGNKVCLVSLDVAVPNGWLIGDKIKLKFFEATYGYNIRSATVDTYYEPIVQHYDEATGQYSLEVTDRFFDEGEFEIVGFYSGKITRSLFSKDVQYTKDEGIDRRVVIVPSNSVQHQPEVPLSRYNTTILLDDEQTMYFMSDMEASGLMEQKKGQYRVNFKIYDQGYGAIKQSLRQLDTVSRLTLYLACAAAVVVIILLAALTVLQNRRQIATLRSLGVKKRQIPAAVLSGLLLVCLLGAVVGGVVGHSLSDRVAEYILDTAQVDLADTSFSAMLAKEDVEQEDLYAITIQSQPQAAAFAAASVWVALALLCFILVIPESKKSPMLTLGARE